MLSLNSRAAVTKALNNPDIDIDLRALIGQRAWQLYVEQHELLSEDIKFVVVEGGDTPNTINEALGFEITGDQPEAPNFESIEDHGLWFEIACHRSDEPRTFIFVENSPATEFGIHYLCLAHLWEDDRSN